MKNKKVLAGLFVLLVIVVGGYWLNSSYSNSGQSKTINVGAVLSLSSYGANDGESIKNGLELARKELAKKNIIVNIDYFDDATDPKQVATGIQYMKSKNIDVVFGPIWSYLGDTALGVVGGSNITLLAPSMTSEVVQKSSPQILFGQVKNTTKLPSVVKWMRDNNIKKPAIIVNQISWGTVHADIFAEAVKSVGGVVVLNDQVGFGKEKEVLPALILKAKSLGADAVMWSGSNDGEVVIINEMTKLSMSIPFFADEEIMSAFNLGLISRDASVDVYTFKKEMDPEYVLKYKAEYGKEPFHYSDASYDMLMAVVKVLEDNDSGTIKERLNDLNYEGYAGTYKFDANGDISGGQWETVKVTN